MHNSDQSDFDLFADYTYAKIGIISIINVDFFVYQYNKVMCNQLNTI